MSGARGSVLILFGLLALGGCTETQFADSLGVGKAAPDEGSVRINQALSIPPDLRLSPPSNKTVEYGTPNKVATYQAVARPVTAEPSDINEVATDEPVMTASTAPTEPVKTAEAAATANTTAATTTAATEPPKPLTIDDTYQKYGISKTYADGKPKPAGVLNDELHKAELAEKRAKNPGYGTIWNMGDMFSSD